MSHTLLKTFFTLFCIGILAIAVYYVAMPHAPKPTTSIGTATTLTGKLTVEDQKYFITANSKKIQIIDALSTQIQPALDKKVGKQITAFGEIFGQENDSFAILWLDGKVLAQEKDVLMTPTTDQKFQAV